MQETLEAILDAIAEAATKIRRFEPSDENISSARTAFILALTYGMLENRMNYDELEDSDDAEH